MSINQVRQILIRSNIYQYIRFLFYISVSRDCLILQFIMQKVMIKIKDWYTEKGFEHNNFYFFEKILKYCIVCLEKGGQLTCSSLRLET